MDKDFTALVQMFHAQACIATGRIKNPLSNQTEKNLDQAQMFIDLLSMIEKKTSGNLSGEEEQFLQQALHEVRLYFVEAQK